MNWPAFFTWSIWCRIMRWRWCHTTSFTKSTDTFINCCNRSASSAISIFFTSTFTSTSLSFRRGATFFSFLSRLLIWMCSLNFFLSLNICLIVFKDSAFRNPLIPTIYIKIIITILIVLKVDNIRWNHTSYSILHNEWNI